MIIFHFDAHAMIENNLVLSSKYLTLNDCSRYWSANLREGHMLYILVSQVDLENKDNEIYWLASGIPVHHS